MALVFVGANLSAHGWAVATQRTVMMPMSMVKKGPCPAVKKSPCPAVNMPVVNITAQFQAVKSPLLLLVVRRRL